MTSIFKAKTSGGYIVKVLAELLQNNIKTACFEVDEDGITLAQMDNNHTILMQFVLDSENFSVYKYKIEGSMSWGINLNHFHKMLKSIKKKDSVQLFIKDDAPTDLGIKVIPKENNRITTSFIKIQSIQNIDIAVPEGYGKPIIVPSADFAKMIKDLSMGSVINIIAKNFHIKFRCNAGGVLKRNVDFGEIDDSEDEEEDDDSTEYEAEFDTDQLSHITKISGLSTNIQIYAKQGLPLLFKSAIGTLGKLSIYIKSKDLQDSNNRSQNSSDED